MSKEGRTIWKSGEALYGIVFRKTTSKVWRPSTEEWESHGTGSRTNNDYESVTVSEEGNSGYYWFDFPTGITIAALFDIQLYAKKGAESADGDTPAGLVEIDWSGTAAVTVEVVAETATSLSNYALAKIGGAGQDVATFRITSINDGTNTANLCQTLYPPVRDEVLCRAFWAEATKYADLGAAVSGIEKGDWEYAFNLPSDYLGRCKQINESYHRSTKTRYTVEYDKEIVQGRLFTNHYSNAADDSAYIKYVFKLIIPANFSPLLYEAIATKLAAELSGPLLNDGGRRRMQLIGEYEEYVLPIAIGTDKEQIGDNEDEGGYSAITCRTI